uniref:ATP synthase F1 complex delta/epsilon subunit N-terminal domain-containing protein n=1 Tax=Alexandrium monilatum TaxID=311494 RepID=A0A7S4VE37_9DINO
MARTQSLPALACALAGLLLVRQAGLLFSGAGTSKSLRRSAPRRSPTALRAEEGSAGSGSDRVQLKVLSPEGLGVTEAVSEVVLPSASGQLGKLANHAPMMTALDIGVLRYKQARQWKPLVVMGGFASVDSNQLSILVNDFEKVEDIDLDAAKKVGNLCPGEGRLQDGQAGCHAERQEGRGAGAGRRVRPEEVRPAEVRSATPASADVSK